MSEAMEKLLAAHTEQDREQFDKIDTKLDLLQAEVTELKASLRQYKGFLGGVIFVISALWAALTFFVK